MTFKNLYKTLYFCPNLNLKGTQKFREFSAKSQKEAFRLAFSLCWNFENFDILGIIIETFEVIPKIPKYSFKSNIFRFRSWNFKIWPINGFLVVFPIHRKPESHGKKSHGIFQKKGKIAWTMRHGKWKFLDFREISKNRILDPLKSHLYGSSGLAVITVFSSVVKSEKIDTTPDYPDYFRFSEKW